MFDISYLTTDSLEEGVGSSQILPLVVKLAERGLKVNLLTFEKASPRLETQDLLKKFGIFWNPREFGNRGAFAGIDRLHKIYKQMPEARVFHARSDIPAVAALISKQGPVLWDVRGLWSDHKCNDGRYLTWRNFIQGRFGCGFDEGADCTGEVQRKLCREDRGRSGLVL